MTLLKSIFSQPVDRPIEGVIKADALDSLVLEVKEYVLTNEVAAQMENFLNAYNNYTGSNGVWVSGFFGSGKSHLLKMLALLMENRKIDGRPVLEMFLPKCKDNTILAGDLNRAAAIPSRSILFNIDQKAKAMHMKGSSFDALLAVFVNVFDDMCGYYGNQGYIAQFERDLDSRDLFQPFKKEFLDISGRPWEQGREQVLLEAQNIAAAYARITGGDETVYADILNKYRQDYKVSIEDFALAVNEYIAKQEKNFRLNFFVDEVGQYIAGNIKLMTNLQTIAESLQTKCKGRAWVIVTAQEDMDEITGEMDKQTANDFSKIQARFKHRLKLTSKDVAEVIQKRLLEKNDLGIETLSGLYHRQSNNFKTLFNFTDGSHAYKGFSDRDHFIHSYPFIPYQYDLFKSAIENLSAHNAFEGRHSSVGERSMLGVFQEVAVKINSEEAGCLAAFDLMYEGIRPTLKSQIQSSIHLAEKNLSDSFALRVLKALFMVKYIKEFKATPRNILVLMQDRFDMDFARLEHDIKEALKTLENQTYIQRTGDLFEFLTDDEKDIEKEIKNTDIDDALVNKKLEEIVFEDAISLKKIRNRKTGQDFPFSRIMDDRLTGREHELAIHIVTPFHDHYDQQAKILMQAMTRDELLVIMPQDKRLFDDMHLFIKTRKYLNQNYSNSLKKNIRNILEARIHQNDNRLADIRESVRRLLSTGSYYIAGNQVEPDGKDPSTRVADGFNQLVARTYTNLPMLRDISYTESDLPQCLDTSQLFGENGIELSEPEYEILAYIGSKDREGMQSTIKNVVDHFERKPYGWYLAAITCQIAKLGAKGKIDLYLDGGNLENSAVLHALKNTKGHANVIIKPREEFSASRVRWLKDFFADYFDGPPGSSEARALALETARKFAEHLETLDQLIKETVDYTFASLLVEPRKKVKEMTGREYGFYLKELPQHEDTLYEHKENIVLPLLKFLRSDQKKSYDNALEFFQQNASNFSEIHGSDHLELSKLIASPDCFKSNCMQKINALVAQLTESITHRERLEKLSALEKIDALRQRLESGSEFSALEPVQQRKLLQPFERFARDLENYTLIAVIRDKTRRFEEHEYHGIVTRMAQMTAPLPPETAPAPTAPQNIPGAPTLKEPVKEPEKEPEDDFISHRDIKINIQKTWLADESDVQTYIDALRKKMLDEIAKGKRIHI